YLERNDNSVNLTTIYRYLDKLVLQGLISKYTDDTGKKSTYRYVGENSFCHEHLHLQCSTCGKVIHLDCEFMNELMDHITQSHGFDIRCDKSILYGKCKSCKEKENM
ncbi:MAG: transcriptional repressor, partial [Oscillospiraceae bacterium]